MVSSEAQKFFILDEIISFFSWIMLLVLHLKILCLSQGHKKYSSVFSPSSSLALAFRSVIHFKFVWLWSKVIFVQVDTELALALFVNKSVMVTSFYESVDYECKDLFQDAKFCLLICLSFP